MEKNIPRSHQLFMHYFTDSGGTATIHSVHFVTHQCSRKEWNSAHSDTRQRKTSKKTTMHRNYSHLETKSNMEKIFLLSLICCIGQAKIGFGLMNLLAVVGKQAPH